MVDARERPVLLVGSVPLGSSSVVFEAVGTKLGKLIKRIPDGETGARKNWVVWQADVFKNAKGLEPCSTRVSQGGHHLILYKVKPGESVKFGPLGYAAAAIRSYEDFKRAPTPIAVVMTFTEPEAMGGVTLGVNALVDVSISGLPLLEVTKFLNAVHTERVLVPADMLSKLNKRVHLKVKRKRFADVLKRLDLSTTGHSKKKTKRKSAR